MCNNSLFRVCCVLMLGLFAVDADARLSESLIAYYPLDGDTRDATGNGHDGEIVGDPQTVPGMFGDALEFDGMDDYVLVAGYVPVSGADDRAVTVWVKMVTTDVQGIISWGQNAGQSKWVVRLSPKGQIRLEIEGAAIKGNSRLADGEWHHIAASFTNDGTPALGDVDLYADGNLQNHANQGLQINTSETGNLEIGRNLKNDGFFEGAIDEVKIYDRALTADEIIEDMEGPPSYSFTTNPYPADGDGDVSRSVVLSWTPSNPANKQNVYFGADIYTVSQADTDNSLGVLASRDQDPNSFTPLEFLEFDKTYYWRVDEINSFDLAVFRGDVWQFTVEPFAYPVENILATASSSITDRGPENTANGSGLDQNGLLHDKIADGTMWLSDLTLDQPTWIDFEFDKIHKLHEMWIWNYNDTTEPTIGSGFKDVTIEYSVDGIDYTTLGETHEFARAPGMPDYAHNTTIAFDGTPARYVRLTPKSNWGDILTQYGLSEVRFLSIPVQARKPYPAPGVVDMDTNTILSWTAGREAVTHDVYLSADPQAVAEGTALVSTGDQTSYSFASLDLGTTYYWRIDEVNDTQTPAVWRGDVWEFRTHEFIAIDDFESYTDDDTAGQTIWQTWIDGFEVPENGAQVGYLLPPYAEQKIVHDGSQSMPLIYDNSTASYSQATASTDSLKGRRDWTINGIENLSLWFRGYPASSGSFTEAPAGTFIVTASGADIGGSADEFHFAYRVLTGPGSIVSRVDSVQPTHNMARAGVMIRETLDPGSRYALACVTANSGVVFQGRVETDGNTFSTNQAGPSTPYWVKLERDAGGNLSASHSADGITWKPVENTVATNIPMTVAVYVGLAVTSRNAAQTCEAVFSNVAATGTVAGQWTSQDIGILSNDPQPLYVAISNAAGEPVAVYHENPVAATIDTWTQWIIPLQEFAAQGLDLTDVDEIAIGLGAEDDPTAPDTGGSGVIYLDDIRLYREVPDGSM